MIASRTSTYILYFIPYTAYLDSRAKTFKSITNAMPMLRPTIKTTAVTKMTIFCIFVMGRMTRSRSYLQRTRGLWWHTSRTAANGSTDLTRSYSYTISNFPSWQNKWCFYCSTSWTYCYCCLPRLFKPSGCQ